MGAGLPSAMAAKIVHPDRDVIAICGDGGFMMNSQEMETAVRLGLNLTVIILRDDSYGMIRWKQANMDFTDFGLTFGNPDFVPYAQSYGAKGPRITSSDELLPLLKRCQAEPGGTGNAGTLEVTAPFDGCVIGSVETADAATVEKALATAAGLHSDPSKRLPT